MHSGRGWSSLSEQNVDQGMIQVGQKYECRYNNDLDDVMISCITKDKKVVETWLFQYSGQPSQTFVDECNISAKNGNVIVTFESPEKAPKKAARDKKKGAAAKPGVFMDIPVVVTIENTNVVGPTREKSTSEGPSVMAAVQ